MAEEQDEGKLQAAESVLAHVQTLWDDQVAFAEALVEKRKNFSSMLAIIVGLGVFRVQFTKSQDDTLVVGGRSLDLVQWSLVAALAAFLCGGYFLYTQRPTCRRCGHWCWDRIRRWAVYLWKLARRKPEQQEPEMTDAAPPLWPSIRAVSLLLPDDEEIDDWLMLDAVSVTQLRVQRLRKAYQSLTTQNRRVAKRLRTALIWLFLGYLLVFLALATYIVCIGRSP